jgi:hypothetical protein
MGVNREWRCYAHDLAFESTDDHPHCPSGCSPKFVVQEFRTPPGIRSGGTKVFDTMQKQLAQDYNLTDMRNDKDGSSVMSRTPTSSGGTRVIGEKPPATAYWNPSLFPVTPGWAKRGEPEPRFNPASAKIVDGGVPVKVIREGARHHLKTATRFVDPGKIKAAKK